MYVQVTVDYQWTGIIILDALMDLNSNENILQTNNKNYNHDELLTVQLKGKKRPIFIEIFSCIESDLM